MRLIFQKTVAGREMALQNRSSPAQEETDVQVRTENKAKILLEQNLTQTLVHLLSVASHVKLKPNLWEK